MFITKHTKSTKFPELSHDSVPFVNFVVPRRTVSCACDQKNG